MDWSAHGGELSTRAEIRRRAPCLLWWWGLILLPLMSSTPRGQTSAVVLRGGDGTPVAVTITIVDGGASSPSPTYVVTAAAVGEQDTLSTVFSEPVLLSDGHDLIRWVDSVFPVIPMEEDDNRDNRKVKTWEDDMGNTHTVRTYKRPLETVPDFEARHDEAVAALMDLFPEAESSFITRAPGRSRQAA